MENKEQENTQENKVVSTNTKQQLIEDVVLDKIKVYESVGMVLPKGFNPTNSLKAAKLILNNMTIRVETDNGWKDLPVLQVCDRGSIIQCLLESCCKGLDYSENQIYFITRKDKNTNTYKMTNMESVYGRITRAKRASRYYEPNVQYIHEGDDFQLGVFTYQDYIEKKCDKKELGKYYVKKQNIDIKNLDNPIIFAYTYVTDDNGNTILFPMTKKEWLKSWSKSSNNCSVAKDFERDMIYRTIIKKSTKSLVNSNIKFIGKEEDDDTPLASNTKPNIIENTDEKNQEFEEAQIIEDVTNKEDTQEIKQIEKDTQQVEENPIVENNINEVKIDDNPPF